MSSPPEPHIGTALRGCARCETLPDPLTGEAGSLHLRFPLTHSLGKALGALKSGGHRFSERDGLVTVPVQGNSLAELSADLAAGLSALEQEDVRVLFVPEGKQMGIADYLEASSLRAFHAKTKSGWLIDMMREQRLTVWFQPILSSAASGEVFAYECLLRGRDSQGIVSPGQIIEVARGAEMLFQIDLAARRAAIEHAAAQRIRSKIFINFMPTAIYDPQFCLRSTVAAIRDAGLSNDRVVFEVVESERVNDVTHLRNVLEYYRSHGFGIALDDLGSGYSSLNMLHQLRPDFVKLDMSLIRDIDQDNYKALIARKLIEVAQGLGIRTVAEGVETQGEFDWLRANGADLVQGYLFARPAAVPPLADRQP